MTLVLRKLPTPQRQPNGTYTIRWRHDGVYKRKNFPTREDANAFITTNMVAESKRDARKARRAFSHYAEEYLTSYLPDVRDVKASHIRSERTKLTHALAFFGDRPVADIEPSDCDAFRAAVRAGKTSPTRPGRKPRNATVNHAYRVFAKVLDRAVRDRAITVNPARVESDEPKTTRQRKFEPCFLTAGQVEALAENLTEQGKAPYDLMARFLARTGLRASENSGLNVADIVLSRRKDGTWRGYVDVHRNRYKLDGEWVEETPKSEKSIRRVDLSSELAADLHAYLTETHPDGGNPDAPLWPGRQPGGGVTRGPRKGTGRFRLNWSEPVEMGAWHRNVFKPALRLAGCPERTRVHDLRHTFASLWLDAGGDIYRLSEQMGHESYQTTLKFYAHLQPKDEDAPHIFDTRPAAAPRADNVIDLNARRRSA